MCFGSAQRGIVTLKSVIVAPFQRKNIIKLILSQIFQFNDSDVHFGRVTSISSENKGNTYVHLIKWQKILSYTYFRMRNISLSKYQFCVLNVYFWKVKLKVWIYFAFLFSKMRPKIVFHKTKMTEMPLQLNFNDFLHNTPC